eukprot:CAMPEP_0184654342 /NCGR_PEP_ID=MMETSP0308-20130426/12036_1 /TAXON_ID=38269 /ORGANISM="Gloeochaete witrockiana, Strain SAG 46.84" /LENGTH=319 /DNA_ID=CAMNT_0027090291 /DNA_START=44 /DNA_END=1003 /DNA_ORIENTATION=-
MAARGLAGLFASGYGSLSQRVGAAAVTGAVGEAGGVRYMASGKEVKNRMKSVGNIRKITKSMKMVAASRLRGAQTRMEVAVPYGKALSTFLESPTGESPATIISGKGVKLLVIGVTSDRGLCGGINSTVVKAAKIELNQQTKSGTELAIAVLGDKGRPMLQRDWSNSFLLSTSELYKKPLTYLTASLVADKVLAQPFDQVVVIFNHFKSVIAYDLVKQPISSTSTLMTRATEFDAYEWEGDKPELMQNLFEFNLANSLYSALLESSTSEQAARMTAMDNATSNAGDMINKLQLSYNRSRQSQITTELIEIISGAESLKG